MLILGLGKRDVSYDYELPIVSNFYRGTTPIPVEDLSSHKIVRLNDQHAYMEVPSDSPIKEGDTVSVGISHPCTTFDKWRHLYVVDSNYNVVDAVRTWF